MKMVCDKDKWDNIDIIFMPKKAMCMSSHRQPIKGAAKQASQHAITAKFPTIQPKSECS